MSTTLNHAEQLQSLLNRLKKQFSPQPPAPIEDPLEQLVSSLLLWESTTPKAEAARRRLDSAVVDVNELRVCLAEEIVQLLGERYPRAEEHAMRLRAALNDIYIREHAVTLEHLKKVNKRDARQYLESLEGLPQYVAARVMLLTLGGHAAPLEERLLGRLVAEGVMEPELPIEKAASIMERNIKASDALEAHLLLQAWSEAAGIKQDPVRPTQPVFKESDASSASKSAARSGGKPAAPPAKPATPAKGARKPASKKSGKKVGPEATRN